MSWVRIEIWCDRRIRMGDSVLQSDLWTNHLSSSVLSIASSVARHAISGSGPSVHRNSATTLSDAAPESFAQIIMRHNQEFDEDAARRQKSKLPVYGNVKPGIEGWLWCSPPETRLHPAGTPTWSRKHNLCFDRGRKFNLSLEGSGADH